MDAIGSTENAGDSANIRILIIDDDVIVAALAKNILERLGYAVQINASPLKALETYARNKDMIDLVLVDYFMPNMDGGATIDHLRKLNPDVKVALFSGADEMRLRQIVRRHNIDGYLHKPLRVEEVRQVFREIFPVPPEAVPSA
jgi:CheY-like chemotaxis protein